MSDSYIEYMNIYKPDVFASLADKITDEVPSLKRIKKSVDRTLKWLDNALSNVKVYLNTFYFFRKVFLRKLFFNVRLLFNRKGSMCLEF